MASGPRYSVKLRRRREGRTDYRHRLRLLKSGLPRLVIRKTSRNIVVQFVEYHPGGDRVIVSAEARELRKLGWNFSIANLPAAYLTGLLAGRRAAAAGVTRTVLDMGLHIPSRGCKIFAALKGALDGGIDVPHDDSILPTEERISGEHVASHLNKPELPGAFESLKETIQNEEVAP